MDFILLTQNLARFEFHTIIYKNTKNIYFEYIKKFSNLLKSKKQN